MKTKIVYVLVSSENDIYLEQAWVSIFSLRHFNPSAHIAIIGDEESICRVKNHPNSEFRGYIDDFIAFNFEKNVSNKERSRWLKTNLRNLVNGDYLFIDTDTIITESLSEIDKINDEIAITLDLHCQLQNHPFRDSIKRRIKKLFAVEVKKGTNYYNSGVIYSKDTKTAHDFYSKWHENWKLSKDKKRGVQDQQSLMVTIDQMGVVQPLAGEYNCQVLGSIEFLQTSKIVHFFNTQWSNGIVSPFFDKAFYEAIKKENDISMEKKQMILNCKLSFVSPSMIVGLNDMKLWVTPLFKLARMIYEQHNILFKLLCYFSEAVLVIDRLLTGKVSR
jgi:hypothetical protein